MDELYFVLIVFLVIVIGVLIFILLRKSNVDRNQSESIRDLERRLTDLMIGQLKEIRDSRSRCTLKTSGQSFPLSDRGVFKIEIQQR